MQLRSDQQWEELAPAKAGPAVLAASRGPQSPKVGIIHVLGALGSVVLQGLLFRLFKGGRKVSSGTGGTEAVMVLTLIFLKSSPARLGVLLWCLGGPKDHRNR